jgi:hypothetical protein
MSETVRHSPEAGLDVVPGEAPAAESQTAEPQAVEATSPPGARRRAGWVAAGVAVVLAAGAAAAWRAGVFSPAAVSGRAAGRAGAGDGGGGAG